MASVRSSVQTKGNSRTWQPKILFEDVVVVLCTKILAHENDSNKKNNHKLYGQNNEKTRRGEKPYM